MRLYVVLARLINQLVGLIDGLDVVPKLIKLTLAIDLYFERIFVVTTA